MKLTVTFRHLPASDALRQHAEQKVQKFLKYLHEPVDIHVILAVEKIRQMAEVNLNAKNFNGHAVEESENMYTSIDKVVSKMEAQLRKHKGKVKNHKPSTKIDQALPGTMPAVDVILQ